MRPTLIILLFLFSDRVCSQEQLLDRYYLNNIQIKKNRVKASIYTSISFPHLNSISEYDEQGREILWYYTNGSTKNHSKFLYHQDTLLEIRFTSNDSIIKSPFEISKYIYNKNGDISFYAACRRSPFTDKTEADFIEFYYGKTGKLNSVLYYSTHNYPFVINEYFPIIDSLFRLTDVENFKYNKNLQLIERRQMIGKNDERYVDSFYYDKQKRLVRNIKHQKEGFVGEMRHSNIYHITEYTFWNSSIVEKKTTQYNDIFGKTFRSAETGYETVRKKNGLTDSIYSIINGKRELAGKFEYSFY